MDESIKDVYSLNYVELQDAEERENIVEWPAI